jgi:hypothetical protein
MLSKAQAEFENVTRKYPDLTDGIVVHAMVRG